MDRRLQEYLDGELELSELPEPLRVEASAWDRLLDDVRDGWSASAPPGLASRVLGAVAAGRADGWRRRIGWLFRPRWVPVPPVAAIGAAALVLAAVAALTVTLGRAPDDPRVYVQFVVDAPTAETVHLVGDFTEWQPTVELEDADGDGVWSGRVPLGAGVHQYMFVIDGSDWITDPNAAGYRDDGFGQRNALVAVETDGT